MHFALPPRKTSRPPPYVASRPSPSIYRRRGRLKVILWSLGGFIFLIILLSQFRRGRSRSIVQEKIPLGTPFVVVVTPLDPSLPKQYRDIIEQNRRQYAAKHNYGVFISDISQYDLSISGKVVDKTKIGQDEPTKDIDDVVPPKSWAKIPALRHAMTTFPYSTYFFFLDQFGLIANPSLSVEHHIMQRSRLEALMIPNQPIVPPSSVIRTLNTRSTELVNLVLTQDHEGLREDSFVIRRGDWAKFFLDSWFDPLYRSYNFQRAEGHALEHLVQWHGTVLTRLALVPQRIMNSYYVGLQDEVFTDGDFVANLHKCDNSTTRSCESEAQIIFDSFKAQLAAAGS